jgi:hypothetical protein
MASTWRRGGLPWERRSQRREASSLSSLCDLVPFKKITLSSKLDRDLLEWNAATRHNAGGEGGIRTPGTLASTPVFETDPFNHSGTSPFCFFGAAKIGLT